MPRSAAGVWVGVSIANPGTGPFHIDQDEIVKVAISRSGTGGTLTLKVRGNGASTLKPVPAGCAIYVDGDLYEELSMSASSSNLTYESIDRNRPSLPGDQTGVANAIQSGVWTVGFSAGSQVALQDDTGIVYPSSYAGGVSCPADGIWVVTAQVTDVNGITLTDGTTSKLLVVPGTNAATTVANTWVTWRIPVAKAVTYTLSGTGIAKLNGAAVFPA